MRQLSLAFHQQNWQEVGRLRKSFSCLARDEGGTLLRIKSKACLRILRRGGTTFQTKKRSTSFWSRCNLIGAMNCPTMACRRTSKWSPPFEIPSHYPKRHPEGTNLGLTNDSGVSQFFPRPQVHHCKVERQRYVYRFNILRCGAPERYLVLHSLC